MLEKKNTPKFFLCVCVRERERKREGGGNNISMMENYVNNGREKYKFIEDGVNMKR